MLVLRNIGLWMKTHNYIIRNKVQWTNQIRISNSTEFRYKNSQVLIFTLVLHRSSIEIFQRFFVVVETSHMSWTLLNLLSFNQWSRNLCFVHTSDMSKFCCRFGSCSLYNCSNMRHIAHILTHKIKTFNHRHMACGGDWVCTKYIKVDKILLTNFSVDSL